MLASLTRLLSAGLEVLSRLAHVAGGRSWLLAVGRGFSSRRLAGLPNAGVSATSSKRQTAGASEFVRLSDWSEQAPRPAQIRGEGDRPLFLVGGAQDGMAALQQSTVSTP